MWRQCRWGSTAAIWSRSSWPIGYCGSTRPKFADHETLLEGIRALPGVEQVALSLPLFPPWAFGVEQPAGEAGMRVSVDYFAAMRLPLIRGRLLTADDLTRADPVVVVNEWYAQEHVSR